MFLTDKGKELMMKQNNLGLSELITRFTLYDDDFDYRTTSQFWWNGVSPQPQMATHPGSDQGLINNDYGPVFPDHPNPKWKNPTTGQTEYHDIPDVRGHRGHNVLSCYPELDTVHIENCTNIYCFYDVTSVDHADAAVAKASLDAWATGYSQTNSAWTGMVFHIPVYGERWINSSYYPWHGELDVFSYNVVENAGSLAAGPFGIRYLPNSTPPSTNAPTPLNYLSPIPGSITTYEDGTTIISGSTPGTGDHGSHYGVTGLFNGVLCNNTDYPVTGFTVLPPGTIDRYGTTTPQFFNDGGTKIDGAKIPGSKLEWFVTGCTIGKGKINMLPSQYAEGYFTASTATTCFHTGLITDTCDGLTGYTRTSNCRYQCTGATWSPNFSGYTVPIIEFTNSCNGTGPWGGNCHCFPIFKVHNNRGFTVTNFKGRSYAWKQLDPNKCEENCCADDAAITGSIFGCQDCNPHRNTVPRTSGRTLVYNFSHSSHGGCYPWGSDSCPGKRVCVDREIKPWSTPCDRYKGGDRNVLIINNTDESSDQNGIGHSPGSSSGGIMPLGEKNYYGLSPVTVNSPSNNTIATWGSPFGERGYQGPIGATTGTINMPATQEYYMGWSEMTTSTNILQPSKDWLYSQDLHCRCLAFYNSFLGFLYPVVHKVDEFRLGFLQHSLAAIMGETIPLADLPVNLTAQSNIGAPITNALQALSSDVTSLGAVGQNPYTEVIPVQYSISQYMLTQGYGPTKTPAWGYTLQGNMNDQMNEGQTNQKILAGLDASWINCAYLSGLKNYGWGGDFEIGCAAPPCSPSALFSPAVYIRSLTRFLSGDTVSQVRTVCTYCQCLPSVFINRTGPPDTIVTGGCLCPNGTYSPLCCPTPTGGDDQLCGPTPVLGTTINTNFTASNPFAPNKNDY